MDAPRILIVDDDASCRRLLLRLLEPHYRVSEASTAEKALDMLISGAQYDVVLCDMSMDGWSGGDLYRRLERRGNDHTSRFVLLTGEDVKKRFPQLAFELGHRVLQKPVDPNLLLTVLTRVVSSRRAA
jgi:CheY-like chemotaxis protein